MSEEIEVLAILRQKKQKIDRDYSDKLRCLHDEAVFKIEEKRAVLRGQIADLSSELRKLDEQYARVVRVFEGEVEPAASIEELPTTIEQAIRYVMRSKKQMTSTAIVDGVLLYLKRSPSSIRSMLSQMCNLREIETEQDPLGMGPAALYRLRDVSINPLQADPPTPSSPSE